METLLTKVQAVESEAAALIERAEADSTSAITKLRSREEKIIQDIREKAHVRAQEIINEHVHEAEKEMNTIKQHGANTAKTVHEAADKNRDDAVALTQRLFQEEYIG